MSTRHLRAVPSPPRTGDRFLVSAQVSASGPQEHTVRLAVPLSGPGRAQIAVRVGRVLVYVADRDALASFLQAWAEASRLADEAFGPVTPPPPYKPRN